MNFLPMDLRLSKFGKWNFVYENVKLSAFLIGSKNLSNVCINSLNDCIWVNIKDYLCVSHHFLLTTH